jgi:hypothetical protein
MTRRESIIATFLIVFSALVGVGIVEAGYHIYQRAFSPLPNRLVVFFDGPDSIFLNRGDIFTYVPNGYISTKTIYLSDSSFSPEFAYKFKTNNFGLVQDRDLVPGVKSILLLGDSFTEGQGAEPWFRQVAPQIERFNYQPINGGLLGTGFLHWRKLAELLSSNEIVVAKVIIIFISDDLRRGIWNFSETTLDCLRNINRCQWNAAFFRLPPASELEHWVAKIRTAREPFDVSFREGIKSALPATYKVYRFFLDVAKRSPNKDGPSQTELVTAVITKMVEKYGRENVLFIQLPQKEELKGTILPDGLLARNS